MLLRSSRRWIAFACICASPAVAQTYVNTFGSSGSHSSCGAALAVVDDLDGDGIREIAVGAPTGDTFVYLGGYVSLYSPSLDHSSTSFEGQTASGAFGHAIARAGDLDGDGTTDLIVGAPDGSWFWWAPIGAGRAFAISSASGAVLHTIAAAGTIGTGWSVDGDGQLDADGVPDFLVGSPWTGASQEGEVFAISGASGALLYTVQGAASDTCGFSVAFVGDVNADTFDDFVVGSPHDGAFADGNVRMIDGASGATLWTATGVNIAGIGNEYGYHVARITDLNGNGSPDVLIGARESNCPTVFCDGFGSCDVRDGATGALIHRIASSDPHAGFGWSSADLGDLDGDGVADFAVGSPDTQGSTYAPVRVYSGATAQLIASIPVPNANLELWSLALARGDTNGDGLDELIIGQPRLAMYDQPGSVAGYDVVRKPTVYCVADVNSLGCTPAIGFSGVASASSPASFSISADHVLNQRAGLLFYGFRPQQTFAGYLCIHGPFGRTPIQNSGGNVGPSDCSGSLAFDFNAHIQSGVDPRLVVGEEVYAEYWSRDPAAQDTINLTDAVAFYINP